MQIQSAQLAGGDHNADRLFVTDNAVIVLDGASAFEPVDVDPGTYAETLGAAIAEQLEADPNAGLSDAVATAISHTARALDLTPGRSPSSTVSILRVGPDAADLYVLGDSPIYYGTDTTTYGLADDRLAALPLPERDAYTASLRAGHGYDDEHRARLAELQRAERRHRNTEGGYWIAETDPRAARQAITTTLDPDAISWAVLATDGASDLLEYFGRHDWPAIAQCDSAGLAALLGRLDRWETRKDPDGVHFPRAKRHDDKTVAAVPAVW